MGIWCFPCPILVLFLVLKYNGVCLCLFPFCLIGMLRVVRIAAASLSMGSGDTLGNSSLFSASSFPFPFSSLSFSSSSPSSSSLCSYVSSAFPSVSSPMSFSFYSSSSSSISSSSSSLEMGIFSYSRGFISPSIFMSLKVSHVIGILRCWRASSMMSLINPWWTSCWWFPSYTFMLISIIYWRRK